jgi:hypothetical protein
MDCAGARVLAPAFEKRLGVEGCGVEDVVGFSMKPAHMMCATPTAADGLAVLVAHEVVGAVGVPDDDRAPATRSNPLCNRRYLVERGQCPRLGSPEDVTIFGARSA